MVAGLLLAAGAGRRFGMPKALARIDGEPMVRRTFHVLADAGCRPVCVVLGARADEVRAELPAEAQPVRASDWELGMGASLRAGLNRLAALRPRPDATLVHLVDLPDVGEDAVRRVCAHASERAVARAAYHGEPGHPVLLGSHWWDEITSGLGGDRGAREWLRSRPDLELVECSDLAGGADVDAPAELRSYARGCDGS